VSLTVPQQELKHATESEAFFSSILEIKVGKNKTQQAVVRDMQRHPFKPLILHIDFMRVSAKEALRIAVPIHFVGEDVSPAGKTSGVIVQHQVTEVEISALPKDIPEFLSVDLSELEAGEAVMLSSIVLPEGVTIPALEIEGDDNDVPVANAVHVKESQGTGAAAAAEAEAAEAAGELGEEEIPGDEEEAEEETPEEDSE
jgi:large subunit ribosomal protein L25